MNPISASDSQLSRGGSSRTNASRTTEPIANRVKMSVVGDTSRSAVFVATNEMPHMMTASRAPNRGGIRENVTPAFSILNFQFTSRIRPEDADRFAHLAQMFDAAKNVRIVRGADQVHVGRVLPRTAFDRSGLDLRKADVAQCERRQRAEQRPGTIRRAKQQRRLERPVRLHGRLSRRFQQEKSGVVLMVI